MDSEAFFIPDPGRQGEKIPLFTSVLAIQLEQNKHGCANAAGRGSTTEQLRYVQTVITTSCFCKSSSPNRLSLAVSDCPPEADAALIRLPSRVPWHSA